MSEIKTKPGDIDIDKFLMSIEPEKKRADSIELKKLFDSHSKRKTLLVEQQYDRIWFFSLQI